MVPIDLTDSVLYWANRHDLGLALHRVRITLTWQAPFNELRGLTGRSNVQGEGDLCSCRSEINSRIVVRDLYSANDLDCISVSI